MDAQDNGQKVHFLCHYSCNIWGESVIEKPRVEFFLTQGRQEAETQRFNGFSIATLGRRGFALRIFFFK